MCIKGIVGSIWERWVWGENEVDLIQKSYLEMYVTSSYIRKLAKSRLTRVVVLRRRERSWLTDAKRLCPYVPLCSSNFLMCQGRLNFFEVYNIWWRKRWQAEMRVSSVQQKTASIVRCERLAVFKPETGAVKFLLRLRRWVCYTCSEKVLDTSRILSNGRYHIK